MDFLILGAIMVFRVLQSISGKPCSRLMPAEKRGVFAYLSVKMAFSAITALVVLLFEGNVLANVTGMPPLGWLIALATGVTLAISTFCSLKAMQGASIVLGKLFGAAGLLIPTVSGIFLYGQSVSVGQWIGILCLFGSALLLASSSKKTNGAITVGTVALLFGSMLANGGTMLLQTMYRTYVPQGSVSVYSLLQFAIPSVCLFAVCTVQTVHQRASYPRLGKKLLGYSALAAVAVLGVSQLSTIASAFIPVGVLFPISDGGSTVISALVAAIVFKERLTVQSVCGVVVGVAGLIMIKLLAA